MPQQPTSPQDKSNRPTQSTSERDTRQTQTTPERDKPAQDLKTQDPAKTVDENDSDDSDTDSDDDQTYIVHTTSSVDDKGVRHDKQHRMTTEEYPDRAKKEGW